jgi:hypothetical protein
MAAMAHGSFGLAYTRCLLLTLYDSSRFGKSHTSLDVNWRRGIPLIDLRKLFYAFEEIEAMWPQYSFFWMWVPHSDRRELRQRAVSSIASLDPDIYSSEVLLRPRRNPATTRHNHAEGYNWLSMYNMLTWRQANRRDYDSGYVPCYRESRRLRPDHKATRAARAHELGSESVFLSRLGRRP